MVSKKDIFRVLSAFPLFYLLYFFLAIIWFNPYGKFKDPLINIFLVGLIASITLILPVWFLLAGNMLWKPEARRTGYISLTLFIIPALALFYLLVINDLFCFWGCILD